MTSNLGMREYHACATHTYCMLFFRVCVTQILSYIFIFFKFCRRTIYVVFPNPHPCILYSVSKTQIKGHGQAMHT